MTVAWTMAELLAIALGLGSLVAATQTTSAGKRLKEFEATLLLADQRSAEIGRELQNTHSSLAEEQQRNAGLEDRLQDTRNRLETLQRKVTQNHQHEQTIRKELVGLQGDLKRTVILIDRSESMAWTRPGSHDTQNRWAQVREVMQTWVHYLAIREAKLVTFGTSVDVEPAGDRFLRLTGTEGTANRQRLLNHLETIEPKGATNTLQALRIAFDLPGVDSMILFTDGAPTRIGSRFDPAQAEEILTLCREQAPRKIPINVIAVGDYFHEDLGGFLVQLAEITGGTLIGR